VHGIRAREKAANIYALSSAREGAKPRRSPFFLRGFAPSREEESWNADRRGIGVSIQRSQRDVFRLLAS
jgi:hypothetical protein